MKKVKYTYYRTIFLLVTLSRSLRSGSLSVCLTSFSSAVEFNGEYFRHYSAIMFLISRFWKAADVTGM
jgi:hypothetical protein